MRQAQQLLSGPASAALLVNIISLAVFFVQIDSSDGFFFASCLCWYLNIILSLKWKGKERDMFIMRVELCRVQHVLLLICIPILEALKVWTMAVKCFLCSSVYSIFSSLDSWIYCWLNSFLFPFFLLIGVERNLGSLRLHGFLLYENLDSKISEFMESLYRCVHVHICIYVFEGTHCQSWY